METPTKRQNGFEAKEFAKPQENPGSEIPPAPGQSPFKGLQCFEVADADLFFGREVLTAQLIAHLRQQPFLAVVGASGSGKSSLVRAGVVSAIQRGEKLIDGASPPEGSASWPVHMITPSTHPLEGLALSVTQTDSALATTSTLMDDMRRDPRSLHLYLRKLISGGDLLHRPRQALLVIDQFEEVFTLCHDKAERQAFIDNLLIAVNPALTQPTETSPTDTPTTLRIGTESRTRGGSATVIITLRADFYANCAESATLRTALERWQKFIGPMSPQEIRRAIEEPARRTGWNFEPGLVDMFVQDVGSEPGALPLLSHALLETWQRRSGRTMTVAGYMAAGRVQGAIAKTAESVYKDHFTQEQQRIAQSIFLRLTELGEGAQDTRRRVPFAELIPRLEEMPQVEEVLGALVDARLLTTSEGAVEVAHEALIREWPTLREWLTVNREGLRIHRHLTAAAQDWQTLQRDPEALYRGARLVQAEEWLKTHEYE